MMLPNEVNRPKKKKDIRPPDGHGGEECQRDVPRGALLSALWPRVFG